MRLLSAIRHFLVSMLDRIDGHLHTTRRARAIERMRRLEPSSLLFICLGNVCRSPYAERVARHEFPDLDVDSGGFIGPGRGPPDSALEAAAARGMDHSDHRSKVIGGTALAEAGAVFIFDRFNVRDVRSTGSARMDRVFWLGDFDPEWTGKRAIIDPWGRSIEEFAMTFERIDRCLETVLKSLSVREARPESTEGTPEEKA